MRGDNDPDLRVHEQLHQLWAVIIHPRCNLLDCLRHLVATTSRIGFQAFHLSLQVGLLSRRRDSSIERDSSRRAWSFCGLTDNDGSGVELIGIGPAAYLPCLTSTVVRRSPSMDLALARISGLSSIIT